jgi:hypothetical protein
MPTRYKAKDNEIQTLNTFIKLMRATESLNNRLNTHLSKNKGLGKQTPFLIRK